MPALSFASLPRLWHPLCQAYSQRLADWLSAVPARLETLGLLTGHSPYRYKLSQGCGCVCVPQRPGGKTMLLAGLGRILGILAIPAFQRVGNSLAEQLTHADF